MFGAQFAPLSGYPFHAAPQLHDYNPGFILDDTGLPPDGVPPGGVLWTVEAAPGDVTFDSRNGTATYRVANLPIRDYTTILNSSGPSTAATCSFEITWRDPIGNWFSKDSLDTNPGGSYRGLYVETDAVVQWSASDSAGTYRFDSDPGAAVQPDSLRGLAFIGVQSNGCFYDGTCTPLGVTHDPVAKVQALVLAAPRPTPFRDHTVLDYAVARAGPVTLAIHGIDGRLVRTLVAAERAAGVAHASWDGRDDAGRSVAAGVYFARLTTPDTRASRLVVRMR